ncbi:hypothetical protein FBR04_20460 [Betaproteobacteria bacterium PRO7]|jgi:hypothetical protein|nr:hypothetical protein [Betaproteobacteria bacterium PRO7]
MTGAALLAEDVLRLAAADLALRDSAAAALIEAWIDHPPALRVDEVQALPADSVRTIVAMLNLEHVLAEHAGACKRLKRGEINRLMGRLVDLVTVCTAALGASPLH